MPSELLVPLAAKMSEEPFRLIIMDSITANLRVDFTGRGVHHLCTCWFIQVVVALPRCCCPAQPLQNACFMPWK